MLNALLGKKIGMTEVFTEEGVFIPVTVIEAGPCTVMQIKGEEKEGYKALQLGFEDKKRRRATKAEVGHAVRTKSEPKKFVREVRIESPETGEGDQGEAKYEVGQEVDVSIFERIDKVDVSGTSKGKGFAGVVRRWGFRGGPASHGSTTHRKGGAIGMAATPSRVIKGIKMGGRMGGRKRTVKNLDIVRVDTGRHLMLVKGAVPGPNGGYVIIRKSQIAKVVEKKEDEDKDKGAEK